MSYKLWIYVILILVVINSNIGIILAYSPVTLNTPLSVSSHNIINTIFALVLMYLVKMTCGGVGMADLYGRSSVSSSVMI